MPHRKVRFSTLFTGVVLTLLLAAACGTDGAGTVADAGTQPTMTTPNTTPGPDEGVRSEQAPDPQAPPQTVVHRDGPSYYFESLVEMAATSDVVIEGTVVGVGVAPAHSLNGAPAATRNREVEIRVEHVYKGGDVGSTVILEEVGFDTTGGSFQLEGLPWSRVRDTGVFFLYNSTGLPEGRYYQTHADGRLLVEGGDVIDFANTPLAVELDAMTPHEMRRAVRDAVARAEGHNVPPQQPDPLRGEERVDRPDYPRERP